MEERYHKKSNSPSEDKKDSKSFKKLAQNFMEYTSAHGVGRLGASETLFWKIFWSLVCMGAFGMFIFQAIGLFQQYLSNPVATSVSVTFEKRLSFPAVTICNLNMIRQDRIPDEVLNALRTKLDYSWSETNNTGARRRRRNSPTTDTFNSDSTSSNTPTTDSPTSDTTPSTNFPDTTTPSTEYTSTDYTSFDSQDTDYPMTDYTGEPTTDYYDDNEYDDYRYDGDDNFDYYDPDEEEEFPDEDTVSVEAKLRIEIDRLIATLDPAHLALRGHLFADLITNCSWKGIDCKIGNFSKFWVQQWNYKYGNCFTFNSGSDQDGQELRVLKATKPGPSNGLVLHLDIEQEEYIGPLTDQAGIRVLLHDQGSMIFPFEEGFSVSPGISTSVGIKKTQISRLDRFNNKSCLPVDQLSTTNIYRRYRNITTYSQQACLNSCLGISQRIRCKCSETQYPSDKAPCDIFDAKTSKCLRAVKYLFNNDKLKCLEDCRQPCKEEAIQKTISSSDWPSKAYKEHLISQGLWHNDSDNVLVLSIFFNELNYEKIEEKFSYGTVNLLADIGGQLGLWIGISVITVCELFELVVMFFTVCVKKMNAASEVHDVPVYGP